MHRAVCRLWSGAWTQFSILSQFQGRKGNSKTYIVAIDGTYAPFEFMENEQIIGFSRDTLDAVAEKEGMKFEYKNTPWEAIFATLNKGDSDIVSASVTITDERKQSFDFTDPYFEATQLIITPADKASDI